MRARFRVLTKKQRIKQRFWNWWRAFSTPELILGALLFLLSSYYLWVQP